MDVLVAIDDGKTGGGSTDGVVHITVGKQTGTGGEDGPVVLFAAWGDVFFVDFDNVTVLVGDL